MKQLFVLTTALLANIAFAALPSGYTELDYIESTGIQYIDSGYVPNANTKIEAVFANTNLGSMRGCLFGAKNAANSNGYCQYAYGPSSYLYSWGNSSVAPSASKIDSDQHTLVLDKGVFSLDGSVVRTISTWTGVSTNLMICASVDRKVSKTGVVSLEITDKAQLRLYSFVISEGEVPLRSFVPARRDSDNVPGLYDTVGSKFYASETYAEFVQPPPVTPVVADDHWTYDPVANTISDGAWTFVASVNNSIELTVGSPISDPGAGAELDFSKPVTDSSTAYTIVKLNPNFGSYARSGNLASLKLPESGLTSIAIYAFMNCTRLTSVVPFIPDSVTELRESAFENVPVGGSVVMKGIVTIWHKAFRYTKISSATFGPDLKSIKGAFAGGSFDHCSSLATLNFSPEMSGAKFEGQDIFAYCSSLSGTVDLSGFAELSSRLFYQYGGSITKVILSSGLTKVNDEAFYYMSPLKSAEFTGGVPTADKFWKLFVSVSGRMSYSSLIVSVKEEFKDDWKTYCEGEVINDVDSIWKLSLVPNAATAGIYLVYKGTGGGGELGDWIYDNGVVTNATYGWGFAAVATGKVLALGGCTQYPEALSPLCLTNSVTDSAGNRMAIASYNKLFNNGTSALPGADKVSKVIVPNGCPTVGTYSFAGCVNMTEVLLNTNITTIGTSAFSGCTSLSTVTPLLPDSVITVNDYAFDGCPIGGDLVMNGIETLRGSSFRNTKITSAYFGPLLKTITGGYTGGAICYCSVLTNIVFDSAITNAVMSGEHFFCHNKALVGTMDTRGFKTIGGRPFDNTAIEHLLVGADITSVNTLVRGMYKLKDVTFFGDAPTGVGGIFNEPERPDKIGSKQCVTTIVFKAHLDSWLPYAENGVLNRKRSTWAREYIDPGCTDLSLRKLLCADLIPGLKIIIR